MWNKVQITGYEIEISVGGKWRIAAGYISTNFKGKRWFWIGPEYSDEDFSLCEKQIDALIEKYGLPVSPETIMEHFNRELLPPIKQPAPIRVQRKRTKGWKMPENTVSVCRPGKWGNPFKVGASLLDCPFIVIKNIGVSEIEQEAGVVTLDLAVRLYRTWLSKHIGSSVYQAALLELKGKNLACFCPLDQPCHADVLLEIANQTT